MSSILSKELSEKLLSSSSSVIIGSLPGFLGALFFLGFDDLRVLLLDAGLIWSA